jgi:hypothetical protein
VTARPKRQPTEPLPPFGTSEYWWATLPRPPVTQSDADVAVWLEDVAHIGGPAVLNWLSQAENWPATLGPVMRGRMQYYVLKLMHDLDARASREREAAAGAQQRRIEDERREARKRAGWA